MVAMGVSSSNQVTRSTAAECGHDSKAIGEGLIGRSSPTLTAHRNIAVECYDHRGAEGAGLDQIGDSGRDEGCQKLPLVNTRAGAGWRRGRQLVRRADLGFEVRRGIHGVGKEVGCQGRADFQWRFP